jgi:hypothetical protein
MKIFSDIKILFSIIKIYKKMKNILVSYKTTIFGFIAAFIFAFQSGAMSCILNGNIDTQCLRSLLFSAAIAALGAAAKDLNVTGTVKALAFFVAMSFMSSTSIAQTNIPAGQLSYYGQNGAGNNNDVQLVVHNTQAGYSGFNFNGNTNVLLVDSFPIVRYCYTANVDTTVTDTLIAYANIPSRYSVNGKCIGTNSKGNLGLKNLVLVLPKTNNIYSEFSFKFESAISTVTVIVPSGNTGYSVVATITGYTVGSTLTFNNITGSTWIY